MISRRPVRLIVAVVTGLFLSACSSLLSPLPDRTDFYVLVAQPPAVPPAVDPDLHLGVGPITLPGYLDRDQMVVRTGPNSLSISERDYWADSLSSSFGQMLGQDLVARLGCAPMVYYPWYSTTPVTYGIEVNASHFECSAGGNCQLQAQWAIRNGAGTRMFRQGTSDLSEQAAGTDGAAQAAALSRLIGQLSEQIASSIRPLAVANGGLRPD